MMVHAPAAKPIVVITKSLRRNWRTRKDGVRQRYAVRIDNDMPASIGGAVSPATDPSKPDARELSAYRRDVTRWFGLPANVRNSGKPIVIGRPPAVLRMLGVPDEPMQIDRGTLIKVSRPHGDDPKGHGITLEQMKALPEHLADPIAVFKSKTSGGLVVLTPMPDINSELVVAVVHLGKRAGKNVVNDIASVHGRPDDEIARWVRGGLLVYVNKKKNPAGHSALSLQLLSGIPMGRGNPKIATPSDVVKFHTLKKSTRPVLVVFTKESTMDKFDLLKSHIDAYTRSDGTVVQAHDDKRTAKHAHEDKVAAGLKVGLGLAIYRSDASGRTHEVKHDGKFYRAGMMRSNTLSGLLHMIDKKVK